MKTEKEILSKIEILTILNVAENNKDKLTKEQIIFIHYLLKNENFENKEINTIERYQRINILNLCNYDLILNSLQIKKLIAVEILKKGINYKVTDNGRKVIEKLASTYFKKNVQILEEIFKTPIDQKSLREKVIPNVRIIQ